MDVQRVSQDMMKITVCFQGRNDGGLRVWSDDVPGFVLSNANAAAVMEDVEPALEAILSASLGRRVLVAPLTEARDYTLEPKLQLDPFIRPTRREYTSRLATV